MRRVPGPRNRGDSHEDAPLLTEEADLLIEAIALLGQRQQETEVWAAERVQLAEERALAAEQRQLDLERRLDRLEQRLAQLGEQFDPQLPAGPEERLERLRQHVEELRSVTVFDEAAQEQPALDAPAYRVTGPSTTMAEPQPPAAQRPDTPAGPKRADPPVSARRPDSPTAQKGPDLWQRIEGFSPRRMDHLLLLLGLLVVLYAGLWQIAQALGFS
jgi:hypothetical protein